MESATTDSGENANTSSKDESKPPSDHVINGLSNGISSQSEGHHKHKHKDKDKERDRHHDKHKHKDKDRDRERDKERDKHSSSKDKSRDDADRKHKDERKDKDHHRDKNKEHRDKNKDRDRDKEHRSKDKDSRDKVKESSEKNKENRDREYKDKHREHGEKSKHRDQSQSSKSKDHKSSSSSKSENHSSSKDKEKSHSSSSSSSKDKHSCDKHKDKHSSDRHSSKHSSGEKKTDQPSKTEKPTEKERKDIDKVKVKDEPVDSESCSQSTNESNFVAVKSEPSFADADESYQNGDSMGDSVGDTLGDSLESSMKSEPDSMVSVKSEVESEEDIPLSRRKSTSAKRKSLSSESEEDVPLSARKKIKKESASKKRKKTAPSDDEDSEVEKKKKKSKVKKEVKSEPKEAESPTKRKKKAEEEEQQVWKWWEEEKKDDGVKWNFLEHKGPMFAPPYEPLPKSVKFSYNGKEMRLSQNAEEVATFYARMIEHEYTSKDVFNKNFFKDWRKTMTTDEREIITDLKKCNFRSMYEYFIQKSEERKAMSKEEKKKIKEQNEEIAKEYGICTIDGHKEKIGNFRIEPPGLFRGRGEHPKMGMLKRRVMPEDVIINCSRDSKKPVPPDGHKWKEVRHDNTVTWLASWTENVQGQVKYVMLNPSSKLKGEKDWQKYETARKLAKCVDKIRQDYREDWKAKEMRIRQRAVAMYFIDKLALRAGNEKDEDQADTVGCCSLRVEHIQLHKEMDGKENVVVFDFPGKDSIRYYNEVPVEKRVFKNLQLFCDNKKGNDDLFDRLNTAVLNKHLNELMDGLTAKVFRTYNASITLQNQLNELTDPNASIPEKILQYNRANRAVAILCNHQRSVPKSHEKSMGNLKEKIAAKRDQVAQAQKQYKEAKRDAKNGSQSKMVLDKKKKALERLKEQLMKLEVQETDKEENKTIALGTSKLNYLDPRISVAWCKKYGVPLEKVYNKTQRDKFRWAIEMAGPDFVF